MRLKNTLIPMGVVNATPNSFSDGAQFNQYETFVERLKFLSQCQVPIIDIGAESTAPFNFPITHEDEISRYQITLLKSLQYLEAFNIISIDTYRVETISYILSRFKEFGLNKKILWNDISGQFDDDVLDLLTEYPDLQYVYCHNLCPSREESTNHMNFLVPDKKGIDLVKDDFYSVYNNIKRERLQERVWWDPCFGFSKTYKQNINLLEDLPHLARSLPIEKWVVGISKKSFLRKHLVDNFPGANLLSKDALLEKSELLHLQWIQYWSQKMVGEIIVRIHDPIVYWGAVKGI